MTVRPSHRSRIGPQSGDYRTGEAPGAHGKKGEGIELGLILAEEHPGDDVTGKKNETREGGGQAEGDGGQGER